MRRALRWRMSLEKVESDDDRSGMTVVNNWTDTTICLGPAVDPR